jgi:colanic acid biosynthesis glycosyl transferase WcaI
VARLFFVNRFYYPDISATAQMLTDLATDLAAQGQAVTVVTSRLSYEDPAASFAARDSVAGVDIVRVATTRFGRGNLLGRSFDYFSFYIAVTWCLLRMLRRGDVVVAKTDPPLVSVVAALAARLRGARLVNWLQDVFPEVADALGVRVMHGFTGRVARALRNHSLRAASANVAVGERMAQYVRSQTGVQDVAVISNWANDASIIPVSLESNPLRKEWRLEGKFVVGYSGNLGRAHEVKTLLDAALALRDTPAVHFIFIGGGAQMESVRTYAKNQNLSNIECLPYQARGRLAYSLNVPDLHLVSLRPEVEGYIVPSKFYGIVAAGRPVAFVGDPDGEIARLVARADCGSTFRSGDAAGLAGFIRRLANDPATVARMGKNARKALDDQWSQRSSLAAWAALLDKFAATSPKRRV